MASVLSMSSTEQIGEAAKSWHALDEQGPLTLAQLAKKIKAPRDVVMQAVGWLAHEQKIEVEESGRRRIVSLR